MPISRIILLVVAAILLHSCGRLPPLRTWEIPPAPIGSEQIEFSLEAPIRDSPGDPWPYRLGIILPQGIDFDLAGEITVLSESGTHLKSFHFDSATSSNWLEDPNKTSHLISPGTGDYNDIGIEDGNIYRIQIVFDRPLITEAGVAFHFLSHKDTPPKIAK